MTNFFTELQKLGLRETDINIKFVNGNIHVAISRKSEAEDEQKNLPALRIKGTAEELDKEFFPQITKPIEATDKFLTNIEEYEKNLEKAKNSSKMAEEENKKKKKKAEGLQEKAEKMEKDEKPDFAKIAGFYSEAADLFTELNMKKEAKNCSEKAIETRNSNNVATTQSLF